MYNFGYYDMGTLLVFMEECFEGIVEDDMLMLDELYMIDMFSSIADKVDPFKDYLDFRFTQKLSKQVNGSKLIKDKVLPFDMLRAELFYSTQSNIHKTESLVCQQSEEAATAFLLEF